MPLLSAGKAGIASCRACDGARPLRREHKVMVVFNSDRARGSVAAAEEEDDLIDRLIAEHLGSRTELHKRLREPSVGADAALWRLRSTGRGSVASKRVRVKRAL